MGYRDGGGDQRAKHLSKSGSQGGLILSKFRSHSPENWLSVSPLYLAQVRACHAYPIFLDIVTLRLRYCFVIVDIGPGTTL